MPATGRSTTGNATPTGNGIWVVKLFLNVSREEQRARFLKRIGRPEKNWKFSASDVRERRYWHDYQQAYSEMLTCTSTQWAPWYVLPADHKWFTRVCAAAVIAATLIEIGLRAIPLLDCSRPAGTPGG